jgi:nitroimidazol reductase NimA-like FMN-containing flavoprotein (pyridoxamine 5'-phosphate oxidase superfamily)
LVLIELIPTALWTRADLAFDEAMAITNSKPWMELLSETQCWELLGGSPVGRIGVLVDSAPEIYPVNHAVDGQTIVFRTEPGAVLRALNRSPAVSFQVDDFDAATSTGWSVLVKGAAREVTSAQEERPLLGLDLRYWAVGPKPVWVRIEPAEVTGRRILRPEGRDHQ